MFSRYIPRARLCVSLTSLLRALILLPFSRLRRGRVSDLFEKELAEYCGVRYAHTLSSCRVALYFALESLDLPKGSEVLLTPITIPDVVNAIRIAGLKPVFVEMTKDAQNMDVGDLKNKFTGKSRVVLITYLSGLVPDISDIVKFTKDNDMALVEDISQCWDASFGDKKVGTNGRVAVGSFSLGKTIDTLYGGVVLTDDEELYKKIVLKSNDLKKPSKKIILHHIISHFVVGLASHPILFSFFTIHFIRILCKKNPNAIHEIQGRKDNVSESAPYYVNPRVLRDKIPDDALTYFTDLQASLGICLLRDHLRCVNKRRELAGVLWDSLSDVSRSYVPLSAKRTSDAVYWHYPIVIQGDRRAFQLFLLSRGVDSGVYSLPLLSDELAFEKYAVDTPVARDIQVNSVFLPIHHSFDSEQMKRVASVVNEYFDLLPDGGVVANYDKRVDYSLSGKTVLITGASSGLGRALAYEIAKEGAKLVLIDRDEAGLEETISNVKDVSTGYVCDFTRKDLLLNTIDEIRSKHSFVSVLINCAVWDVEGLVDDVPIEKFMASYDVNFYSPLALIHNFIPDMKKNGNGQVVNIVTCMARRAYPGKSAYCVSKASLLSLTESLRVELAPFGVNAMLVFPGPMDTNLIKNTERHGGTKLDIGAFVKKQPPSVVARLIVNGLKKRKKVVRQITLAEFMVFANHFAPWLVDWVMSKVVNIPKKRL